MYHKILVPLDGSKRAEAILPHVLDLARCYQAQVILLQVIEPVPVMTSPTLVYAAPQSLDDSLLRQEAAAYLAGQQALFRNEGLAVVACLEQGSVVDQIIEVAHREEVDLIAMASHGRTGLPRMFYGSVAEGVLHRVDRPLLLIRSDVKD